MGEEADSLLDEGQEGKSNSKDRVIAFVQEDGEKQVSRLRSEWHCR